MRTELVWEGKYDEYGDRREEAKQVAQAGGRECYCLAWEFEMVFAFAGECPGAGAGREAEAGADSPRDYGEASQIAAAVFGSGSAGSGGGVSQTRPDPITRSPHHPSG